MEIISYRKREKIINDNTKDLKRVGVAHILEKMVENMLKWFEYVGRKLVDFVVRRVDQMEGSKTAGRRIPRKL